MNSSLPVVAGIVSTLLFACSTLPMLRKAAATPSGVRLDPAVAMTQLQDAAIAQASVVIGYVDPAGVATQRVVAPINVRGGQLTAYDPASGRVREFAIHRVTSVVSAEPG